MAPRATIGWCGWQVGVRIQRQMGAAIFSRLSDSPRCFRMSSAESRPPKDLLATLRIPRQDESPQASWNGRRLKWVAAFFLLIILTPAVYYLVSGKGLPRSVSSLVPEAIRALPEVQVTTVVVQQGRSAEALVVATGYLESRRQAQIGARAAGRIESISVEEGSPVRAGEIIAVLEHKDMDAALAATQALLARSKAELEEQQVEIARTKADYERAEKLREGRTISTEEYDQARFRYQGAVARGASLQTAIALAEARVREAEQLNENMVIRAPFDGTVISKNAELGESILPGGMGEASGRGSVVTIADLEHLEVDCDVKEDYISRVEVGSPTEVSVDAVPARRYRGRVRKVIPMGDRARATIKVKVEILDADSRLFPEMSATVYFLPDGNENSVEQQQKRIFCDTSAIQSIGDRSVVWLLDQENRAQRAEVETADAKDGRTEIVRGLRGGERVILNPPENVTEGMLLKVAQA